jgi:ligand-binding SRPBCC domain-containing protein
LHGQAMSRCFVVRDEITVHGPMERCFQLSTNLAIIEAELGLHPVAGRMTGLVVGGDTVRWEGRQFGLPQVHESLIEEFRPPVFFRDRMIAGRFARFEHDHRFQSSSDGSVVLADEVRFSMPWGWLGEMVGKLLMIPHVRSLMARRFVRLKRLAEGEGWREFVPPEARPVAAVSIDLCDGLVD